MVDCEQTSAMWLPSTMPSLLSTEPSGSGERPLSAFIHEDSGITALEDCQFLLTRGKSLIEHRHGVDQGSFLLFVRAWSRTRYLAIDCRFCEDVLLATTGRSMRMVWILRA
jgi:hypothetical protein